MTLAMSLFVTAYGPSARAEIVNLEPPSPRVRAGAPVRPGEAGDFAIRPPEPRPSPRAESAARIEHSGPPEALVRLALDYHRGTNGPRNPTEALRLLELAAERGDPRARIASAYLASEALGTERDLPRARTVLDDARRAGSARAAYLRALVEEAGPVAKDRDARVRALLQEAAAAGDALAQNQLGTEYERLGQPGTARLWYQEAIRNGSAAARDNARRLEARLTRQKVRRPMKSLEADAQAGDAAAAFELAQRHHRGDGVAANYAEALRWYREAAMREHAQARQMLGLIYSDAAMAAGINAEWMRRVAMMSFAEDGSGPRLAPFADGLPMRDADPLAGLESLPR